MNRFENESFEDYKKRRALDNKLTKKLLRGYTIWDSGNMPKRESTYVKKIHGDLNENT